MSVGLSPAVKWRTTSRSSPRGYRARIQVPKKPPDAPQYPVRLGSLRARFPAQTTQTPQRGGLYVPPPRPTHGPATEVIAAHFFRRSPGLAASIRVSSPLAISRFKSSAPPTSTHLTNTIGNVGHPVHILRAPRRRQPPK